MDTVPPLARTCCHEAAHAVLGFRLHFEVDFLSAVPSALAGGICLIRPALERAGLEGTAVLAAGEGAAELLDEGFPAPRVNERAGWYVRALENARHTPPDLAAAAALVRTDAEKIAPRDAALARIIGKTLAAVEWRAVLAVAEALAQTGTLEGADARALALAKRSTWPHGAGGRA